MIGPLFIALVLCEGRDAGRSEPAARNEVVCKEVVWLTVRLVFLAFSHGMKKRKVKRTMQENDKNKVSHVDSQEREETLDEFLILFVQ